MTPLANREIVYGINSASIVGRWCGNIVITKFYDSINTESEKTLKY